jgi:hypothetical protein
MFCWLTVASTFAIAAVFASLVMPVRATAADFETIPVDGAPDVYIFRHKDLQAIFVVAAAGVIATDPISHKSASAAAKYLAEIKKITSNPIKYVIYSWNGVVEDNCSRTRAQSSSLTHKRRRC